jgi:formate dehydrogenase accessory protein FdhD
VTRGAGGISNDGNGDSARNRHAQRITGNNEQVDRIETLPEEVPVALVYNGISHAVMLATPADLEDFALGFSLSEGILAKPSELYDREVVFREEGIELQLEIASERFAKPKDRRRNLAGRTGCGLCGVESLSAVARDLPTLPDALRVPVATLRRALAHLRDHQPLHRRTHAVHAAAWVDAEGNIDFVREDVGRHNALDKLIGALTKRPDRKPGFALVTSRASVEMVQKAAGAGIELLFSISAPTALAARVAEDCGLTLVGSVHREPDGEGFSIHTHPQRITQGTP